MLLRLMAKTALELSQEEWKQLSLPQQSITPEIIERCVQAWELMPKFAKLLREEHGAEKVQIFGSAIKASWEMPAKRKKTWMYDRKTSSFQHLT